MIRLTVIFVGLLILFGVVSILGTYYQTAVDRDYEVIEIDEE